MQLLCAAGLSADGGGWHSVAKLGGSSVRYEVGLFAQGEAMTAAAGHFVHVYVDRDTRRPVPVPAPLRAVLEKLLVPAQ